MRKLFAPLSILLLLFLLLGNAFATTITYYDQGEFTTATGAISNGAIPDIGNVGTSQTLNNLTFSAGNSIYFGTDGMISSSYAGSFNDWTSLLTGADIAISGTENLNVSIDITPSIHAFGFNFVEPTTGTVNVAAADVVDSVFKVDLYNDSNVIFESFQFNAPDNEAYFFGAWSSVAINSVQITEIVGGIDNEFFGEFYLGSTAAPVPEPATMMLFGIGILGLAGVSRRKQ